MRALRLIFPLLIPAFAIAACGGGDLVPSDAPPASGGGVSTGGVAPGTGAAPGTGGEGLGGGGLGGAGGAEATGGSETGSGGSDTNPGCTPRVHILLQRSGGMFEHPSAEDAWWDAVAEALDGEDGLLGEFGDDLDISASVFTKVADEACPIGTSVNAPAGAGDLADVLAEQKDDYFALTDPEDPQDAKAVDAPIVEAIEGATSVLTGAGDATILLIALGIPDTCESNNDQCAAEDVFTAVKGAHDAGIDTRLLYLQSSAPNENLDLYPEGIANAGVGLGVEVPQNLTCGSEDFDYSETPGDAPFEAPEDTAGVKQALADILSELVACE